MTFLLQNLHSASRNSCIKILITHCPLLQTINESFLKVSNLCFLDLSYNNLKQIDHNWVDWSSLDQGVNLQGNPIHCTCSSQWMIDFLIPQLHGNRKFHQYLLELRCAAPESFKSHRLVRYLGHARSFCGSKVNSINEFSHFKRNYKFSRKTFKSHLQKNTDYLSLINRYRLDASDYDDESSLNSVQFWIIAALLVTIVILLIWSVIALIRRRRQWNDIRKNNRRYQSNGSL